MSSSTAGVVIQRNSALKNKTAITTTKIERSYGFGAGNLRTHSPSPRSVLKLEELSDGMADSVDIDRSQTTMLESL